jgi:CheY-like chemotaxis protein
MILGNNIIAVNQSKEMMDLLFDLDFKIMNTKDCIHCIRDTIRYRPDLVIADLESPHLNGISMARILNTLMIRTPIILTASDSKFKKHALSFKNVIGFIQHPSRGSGFPRDQVRSELESIIFDI